MNLMIDKSWTLFLDRDGVINERLHDDYVKSFDEFTLIPGSLEAIALMSKHFGRVFVVTNQQGVGKGLMTIGEVENIHKQLIKSVETAGGRIDKIYVSPYLKSANHFTRKPSVGMGILAKREFEGVSFKKSLMVGDSLSDMIFGKRLKMKTVFIGNTLPKLKNVNLIDFHYPDLITFAKSLSK